MAEHLSLAELESFDPRAPMRGRERRFLCPLCGADKPRDTEHRSIAVNTDNGQWICHRCKADGLLKEYWTKRDDRPLLSRERKRAAIKAKFAVKPKAAEPKPEPAAVEKIEKIRARYKQYQAAFSGSPAAQYLASRGIPEELAIAAGCGYAAEWQHWRQEAGQWIKTGTDRRVIFPIRDKAGELVAISARAIDPEYIEPKAETRGAKKFGVFATASALEAKILIPAEAPIDALSLAASGFPAIAMIGTSWPEWLAKHCAFQPVAIATDADEAGDIAAEKLRAELASWGARAIRLRPAGAKDWNDALVASGVQAVKTQVSAAIDAKTYGHELDPLVCSICGHDHSADADCLPNSHQEINSTKMEM